MLGAARPIRPTSPTTSSSFIVDENDGNLTKGTPHSARWRTEISQYFAARRSPGRRTLVQRRAAPLDAVKVVPANSKILQASIHLDKPGKAHIPANTSARSATRSSSRPGSTTQHESYIVWTDRSRSLSLRTANEWAEVGTMFAIDLPAGDHMIHRKIWIAGGRHPERGTLMVEALDLPVVRRPHGGGNRGRWTERTMNERRCWC